MHSFPRPSDERLHVRRSPVDGSCPECDATALAAYRVLGEGGWWEVCKCQECLASLSRVPGPRLGSLVPLGSTV